MASISNDPNGRRRIQFFDAVGNRKAIRLGKVSMRSAESFKVRVEDLVSAVTTQHAPSDATSRWLMTLKPEMYDKLAKAGLVKKRGDTTLGAFAQEYIDGRADIKPGTRINLERIRRYLIEYFGADRQLSAVNAGEAEGFRQYLFAKHKSDNTVRRAIGRSRQFWNAAKKRDLVHENPFDGMAASVRANPERFFYVTREIADNVINACPDAQWKLIFVLARYGGLRCPSEVLAIKWTDVNWEHNRIRVPSPKTEHHEGGASRMIPLFPELRPHLLEVFERAEPGDTHVITRYRDANANLRTQLNRIINRAGLEPWPKLFQNLRSTRETELAETFPMHVVCKWIGNSQPVAAEHYLQLTDDHFNRAIQGNQDGPEKAAQNAAQKLHEMARNEQKSNQRSSADSSENTEELSCFQQSSGDFTLSEVTGLGLEPRTHGLKGRCSTD